MDIDFIADEAHIGGLVTGVLCGVIMAGFSRYRRGLKG
jgi:membrane associated rhomboid family serine protease